MIGDLGVSASLHGFRLTEFFKRAQSCEPFHYLGGVMEFCKSPDPFEMQRIFHNLIQPTGRFYFVYFSDDSCLSIRHSDGTVHMYNLDISSCDASHGPSVFQTLIEITPDALKDEMAILVEQCKAPLRIVSNADKNNVVLLKPKRPMLYSGSVITTAINNLANFMIGMAIAECVYESPLDIERAAMSTGYIVTGCLPLEFPEDLQFLKHSPVQDLEGVFQPLLNFGVLVRASGTCNGDLPGTKNMSLGERAIRFQRGLLRSSYPRASFSLLDFMWEAVGEGDFFETSEFDWKVVKNDDFPPFVVDDNSFLRRYRLDWLGYEDLKVFAGLTYGEFIHNFGVSRVLEIDYGLATTCNTEQVFHELSGFQLF
jgi:hypothetical protein